MYVDIYLTDTTTNESKVYHDNFDWQDTSSDWPASAAIIYQYTEGNYSCDCNRSLFFYDWEADKKKKCGNTITLEKIVNRETGEILWSPELQAKEDLQIKLFRQYGIQFLP